MKASMTLLAPYVAVAVAGSALYLETERDRAPVTNWLQVKSIAVHDSEEGQPVVLSVDRTIRQPFIGEWSATVRQSTPEGFVIQCSATGKGHYSPSAVLPKPLTLDWWTMPVRCALPPGRYRLETLWTVQPQGYPEKNLLVTSNFFTIHARGQ
jgi:hypothetical protein